MTAPSIATPRPANYATRLPARGSGPLFCGLPVLYRQSVLKDWNSERNVPFRRRKGKTQQWKAPPLRQVWGKTGKAGAPVLPGHPQVGQVGADLVEGRDQLTG